jgi:nitrite reductase/ring-hydroxylating ferredoxin subunit
MDAPNNEFTRAGRLEELKAKGRLVLHGAHRPILIIYDRGRVFAVDNRCPHMGSATARGTGAKAPMQATAFSASDWRALTGRSCPGLSATT